MNRIELLLLFSPEVMGSGRKVYHWPGWPEESHGFLVM
jgi:hypothetical protein